MANGALFKRLPHDRLVFYIYFKKIQQKLKERNWSRNANEPIDSIEFTTLSQYNYDAYALLQKTFKRIGWDLKMLRFAKNEQTSDYEYKFSLTKL